MTIANPTVDYVADLLVLRQTYLSGSPQARYNVIQQRLQQTEIGPTRLVTVVSAVEGLARSIAMTRRAGKMSTPHDLYSSYKDRAANTLVEEVLVLHGQSKPSEYFSEDTWALFRHAVNYRNLIAHECTYLGQDKYPSLIAASEEVLYAIVKLANLRNKQA